MPTTLTKMHFKAIAEILGRHQLRETPAYADFVAYLRSQNPAFNESRFFAAVKNAEARAQH